MKGFSLGLVVFGDLTAGRAEAVRQENWYCQAQDPGRSSHPSGVFPVTVTGRVGGSKPLRTEQQMLLEPQKSMVKVWQKGGSRKMKEINGI